MNDNPNPLAVLLAILGALVGLLTGIDRSIKPPPGDRRG